MRRNLSESSPWRFAIVARNSSYSVGVVIAVSDWNEFSTLQRSQNMHSISLTQ
jgi:hypothetical protein